MTSGSKTDAAALQAKMRQEKSAAYLAKAIIGLINTQVYQPGDRLREQEIADRFGVSRGPVREALRILETKTAVRIEPMRGATVVRMSDEETIATIEISGVLFGLAARRACLFASAEQRSEIYEAACRLDTIVGENNSPARFFRATVATGARIATAAKAKSLETRLEEVRIGAPSLFGTLGFLTVTNRQIAASNWKKLAAAICARKSDAAESLARLIHAEACKNALAVRP